MRGFDAFAGVIKSGGKTRRAAKMVILNADHPDIVDFIECKAKEEAKAFTLIKAGYDGSGPDSEAFSSIFFQNANNSVRVSDEFMRAYENDGEFTTYTVKGHEPVATYKARDIMHKIAEATWLCGDPGMQFDTTINKWHTSKNTARINASNPCSEYMFLDNSACNLASFNLMKYVTPRASSTSPPTGTPSPWSSPPWRFWWTTPAIRPRPSPATRTTTARSAWATPTWARCSWPSACPTTRPPAAIWPPSSPPSCTGQAYLQSAIVAANCPPIASATPLTA